MLGILSDIGNVRRVNEDSVGYYEDNEIRIYCVADGMGGHNAGEVASGLVVEGLIKNIKLNRNHEDMGYTLSEAIKKANEEVNILARGKYELRGMGTTVTACYIKKDEMVIANVGDSSCYIIENQRLTKVTKDHSLVQQLIDNGTITEEEAKNHPNKNIITRAIGTSETVDVDIYKLNLINIQKVILCTDGLSNEMNYEEMYDIILNNDNQEACRKMVELSKDKGGRDNISVIVFEGECKDDRNLVRK